MSHLKERSEKNCLNCNAEVQGKYCHICGQENIEPVETAWHLTTHFFNDITHFDGKFFSTLKYLVFRPGFLSKEYIIGRRASYLNPVRLYVFTSAIFFLIFFSITHVEDNFSFKTKFDGKTLEEIEKLDSSQFDKISSEVMKKEKVSREAFRQYADSVKKDDGVHFSSRHYKTKAEYDSVLKKGDIDHGWFQRKMIYKEIELNEKYNNDEQRIMQAFVNNFFHSFPQMLFVLLPLFALILKLLYIRRKQFYYASHAIFSIHLYVFIFFMLFLVIVCQQLDNYLHWDLFNYLVVTIILTMFFYEYKSMRNFYKQRRFKTIMKFALLNISLFFIIILLVIVFSFTSMLKT